jgi:hypothetical protein
MRRRSFITLLGSAAAAWPLAAHAQQRPLPVVGWLNNASPEPYSERVRAFRLGLKEAGFVEPENVAIDFRWANGQDERLPTRSSSRLTVPSAMYLAAPAQDRCWPNPEAPAIGQEVRWSSEPDALVSWPSAMKPKQWDSSSSGRDQWPKPSISPKGLESSSDSVAVLKSTRDGSYISTSVGNKLLTLQIRSEEGAAFEHQTMSRVRNRPHRHNESSYSRYWQAPIYRAVQERIGKELDLRYEVPQELPPRLRALLQQFNERREQEWPSLGASAKPPGATWAVIICIVSRTGFRYSGASSAAFFDYDGGGWRLPLYVIQLLPGGALSSREPDYPLQMAIRESPYATMFLALALVGSWDARALSMKLRRPTPSRLGRGSAWTPAPFAAVRNSLLTPSRYPRGLRIFGK